MHSNLLFLEDSFGSLRDRLLCLSLSMLDLFCLNELKPFLLLVQYSIDRLLFLNCQCFLSCQMVVMSLGCGQLGLQVIMPQLIVVAGSLGTSKNLCSCPACR